MVFQSYMFKNTMKCLLVILLVSIVTPVPGIVLGSSDDLLRISIAKGKQTVQDDGILSVHCILENISDQTLRILRWRTPLAKDIGSNMFVVEKDGKRVSYRGKLIKRRPPQAEDYFSLQPGEAVDAEIDLGKLYDMAETGNYSIQFQLNGRYIQETRELKTSDSEVKQPASIRSNVFEAVLTVPLVGVPHYKAADFSGCTITQQNTLNNALTASQQIARTAKDDLNNAPVNERTNAERYREWFGFYDAGRYATVQNNFDKIDDALSNRQIEFDCSCTQNYYAYVYPSEPYEIYLCNAFWGAQLTGTDSQAGTIVHETSHFTVVAGTDDHIYGQDGCRNLADNYPSDAIDNADSHEYFAENTPNLSMPLPLPPLPPAPTAVIIVPATSLLLL